MFQGYIIVAATNKLMLDFVDYGKVFRTVEAVKEKFNEIMKRYSRSECYDINYIDIDSEHLELDVWKNGEPYRHYSSYPIYC